MSTPRAVRLLLVACVVGRAMADVRPAAVYADADAMETVSTGQRVYKTYCGQCHGRSLQGQALWRLEDADTHRRAPALDPTGHAWQHSDQALFNRIRLGRWSEHEALPPNLMPRYQDLLSESETLAVIAFMKSRWGLGLRAAQSTLNPGLLGMPQNLDDTDWTLPPTCSSTQQQWRTQSP